ncbi:hypothetical protein SCP_1400470 [Sparassis crispa]|uniref:Uncharacterized protein n=1 Tax=Sparassis crispa TaxID=139825 RepID=A0A401H2L5_9APHY|nr:hypothetical protein SCP_1400470 [Sparassis crispa]GBE88642.1 hypothetical protein SCP_1400470 [Sparassis crispa]
MENLESQAWHPGLSSDEPYNNTYQLHLQMMKKAYFDIKIDLDQNPKLHFEVVTATSNAGRLLWDWMDQFNSLIIAQAVTIRFLAALIAILRNSAMREGLVHWRHEDAHSIHDFGTPSWTSSPPAFEFSSPLPVVSTALDPRVLEGNQECDELQLSTTLKPPTLAHGILIHGEESVTLIDPWLCNDALASPPPLAFECSSPVSVASTALDPPMLQENNAWNRFQISSAPKSLAPKHPELTGEDESMQSIDLWQYDDFITLPGGQDAEPQQTVDSFACSMASNDGLYSGDPWVETGCDRGGLVLSGSEADALLPPLPEPMSITAFDDMEIFSI